MMYINFNKKKIDKLAEKKTNKRNIWRLPGLENKSRYKINILENRRPWGGGTATRANSSS